MDHEDGGRRDWLDEGRPSLWRGLEDQGGQFRHLAEFFRFGKNLCSCYDIYRAYLSLPIWIQKRQHSASKSEHGWFRRNAKTLLHQGTGRWGLPVSFWKRSKR